MKAILPYVFWLGWGLWIAIGDLHSAEVQSAVIKLLVGGAVLGFFRPTTWWIWALALSAWVPLEPLVARFLEMPDTFRSTLLGTVLPVIPAVIGGLLGRTVQRTF